MISRIPSNDSRNNNRLRLNNDGFDYCRVWPCHFRFNWLRFAGWVFVDRPPICSLFHFCIDVIDVTFRGTTTVQADENGAPFEHGSSETRSLRIRIRLPQNCGLQVIVFFPGLFGFLCSRF